MTKRSVPVLAKNTKNITKVETALNAKTATTTVPTITVTKKMAARAEITGAIAKTETESVTIIEGTTDVEEIGTMAEEGNENRVTGRERIAMETIKTLIMNAEEILSK